MTYTGHVENGMLVLDKPVRLTEGARVRVEITPEAPSDALHPDILRFTGVVPSDIDVRAEYAEDLAKKHA